MLADSRTFELVAAVCVVLVVAAGCSSASDDRLADSDPPAGSTTTVDSSEGATSSTTSTQVGQGSGSPPSEGEAEFLLVDADSGWAVVDASVAPELDVAGSMNDVTEFGATLVAVGHVCDERLNPEDAPPWPCSPAVWVSADGNSWDRHDLDGLGSLMTVVPFGDVVVAGGQYCGTLEERFGADAVGTGLCRPGIWVAESPESWNRVSNDSIFPACGPQDDGCALAVWDLAATSDMVVAAGHDWGTATRVWRSSDGTEWERANEEPGPWPGGGWGWLDAVHHVSGGFVAVGNACSNDFFCHLAVWAGDAAADNWIHIGDGAEDNPFGPEAAFWATGGGASASDGEYAWVVGVACDGYEGDAMVSLAGCEPALWETSDGHAWQMSKIDPELLGQGETAARLVLVDDETLHATGIELVAGTDSTNRWYISTPRGSLTEWAAQEFSTPDNVTLLSGITVSNGVVLVGTHAPPDAVYDLSTDNPEDQLKPIVFLLAN